MNRGSFHDSTVELPQNEAFRGSIYCLRHEPNDASVLPENKASGAFSRVLFLPFISDVSAVQFRPPLLTIMSVLPTVMLGHTSAGVTQIHAQRDLAVAVKIAAEVE